MEIILCLFLLYENDLIESDFRNMATEKIAMKTQLTEREI